MINGMWMEAALTPIDWDYVHSTDCNWCTMELESELGIEAAKLYVISVIFTSH